MLQNFDEVSLGNWDSMTVDVRICLLEAWKVILIISSLKYVWIKLKPNACQISTFLMLIPPVSNREQSLPRIDMVVF
jgi:hypothetical protein